jgi:hypothetical protein
MNAGGRRAALGGALLRLKFGAHIPTTPVGTYACALVGIHTRRDFKMCRYPPAALR